MTIAIPRLDRTTAADRGLTLADFLVPIPVGERLNARVRHILLIAAGALFIYLTARFAIARPDPWTGQTFGILVVGGASGARRGSPAVTLYVLLGLIGLPFFAEGKGGSAVIPRRIRRVHHRLRRGGHDRGPTRRTRLGPQFSGAVAMMLVGTVVIYAIGLPWLSYVRHLSVADTISGGLAPFIVGTP
jgi:biotin transport system substrate-specific component